MKILSLIFLVVGIGALLVMGYDMIDPGVRGDRLTWLRIGPPVIASFCLAASLALFLVHRSQRDHDRRDRNQRKK